MNRSVLRLSIFLIWLYVDLATCQSCKTIDDTACNDRDCCTYDICELPLGICRHRHLSADDIGDEHRHHDDIVIVRKDRVGDDHRKVNEDQSHIIHDSCVRVTCDPKTCLVELSDAPLGTPCNITEACGTYHCDGHGWCRHQLKSIGCCNHHDSMPDTKIFSIIFWTLLAVGLLVCIIITIFIVAT